MKITVHITNPSPDAARRVTYAVEMMRGLGDRVFIRADSPAPPLLPPPPELFEDEGALQIVSKSPYLSEEEKGTLGFFQ